MLLDTSPRRLGRFFALAVVLHLPVTPLAGLFGLVRFLNTDTEVPVLPPVTEIPLDLIDDDSAPAGKPADTPEGKEPEAAGPEATLPAEPEAALPKPKPKPKPPEDAGVADAESEKPDAGAPDASKTSDAGAADAGAADAGPAHKPGEGIGSPAAAVGNKRVADPNANVQVLIHNDRVREHPLGGRVGPLLRNVYQWRDFFGPTNIDPVRDIDRMLIIGPQLRDSRDVIAILQFRIPQDRVHEAVDGLVKRDPDGAWLDGNVPVARARADRAERFFVFSAPKLLVVTPPASLESAKAVKKVQRPTGDEIAIAYLSTPWRAFLGLPVVIPKSIESAKLRLSPAPDGGVVIEILAHDQTEPLAQSDAQALTAALNAATSLDLGLFGSVLFGSSQKKFIQKGSFEADGTDIRGEIVLTRAQTEMLLDLAGSFLAGRAPKPRAPTPSATAPSPDAVPTPTTAPSAQ